MPQLVNSNGGGGRPGESHSINELQEFVNCDDGGINAESGEPEGDGHSANNDVHLGVVSGGNKRIDEELGVSKDGVDECREFF